MEKYVPTVEGDHDRGGRSRPQREIPSVEGSRAAKRQGIPTREGSPDTGGISRHGRDLPTREVRIFHTARATTSSITITSCFSTRRALPLANDSRLCLADCVVARSATKLGGLGACPHSRKRPSVTSPFQEAIFGHAAQRGKMRDEALIALMRSLNPLLTKEGTNSPVGRKQQSADPKLVVKN